MSVENSALILTQQGYIYKEEMPLFDDIHRLISNQTFSGVLHLGAGLLFSELKALGYKR